MSTQPRNSRRAKTATTFTPIAEIVIHPETALVHEHGWQSWSPTTTYRVGEGPHRPSSDRRRVLRYRPDRVAPADAYQGEGLLVVEPGDGSPAHRFAVADPRGPIPSIRAEVRGARVLVCSDGPVRHDVCAAGPDVALAGWADELARNGGVAPGGLRPAPTMWCSWYGYWQAISDRVILDNVAEIERLGLPVDVVQIDDGYQAEIGDWLQTSPTFGSLRDLTAELRARGRRVGVWTAPFLVGERSQVAKAHPEWLVDDIDLGRHWGQRLFALDVTHPHAAAHLVATFEGFRELGIDVFRSTSSTPARSTGAATALSPAWTPTTPACSSFAAPSVRTRTCWAAGRRSSQASGTSTRCASATTSPRTGSTRTVTWRSAAAAAPS